ncbi:MAG: oligopeptide/dipeptide ABC transporter ATP-binding protein [Gemmatimonadota bacterium]
MGADALVRVKELEVHFPIRKGLLQRKVGAIRAVDGVTFEVFRGETLGLVGESGSGKSTVGRAMLHLEKPTGGEATFRDSALTSMSAGELRRTRRHMQMIFQDPHASLDPRLQVGRAIREPLDIHRIGDGETRAKRVGELLDLVGLDPRTASRYPHEFSGGQLQRIGIARALATSPEFVVADEPISALDVSIQAQIVNLLGRLKRELGLTYLFIAHDLSMVRHLSDRVAVMYLGRIVELGEADSVFGRPLHPYTKALLSAIPIPDPEREARRKRVPLKGDIPSPADPPSGCRFRTRCPLTTEVCTLEDPEFRDLGDGGAHHRVACHHAGPTSKSSSPPPAAS